jgi:hypothetical protein
MIILPEVSENSKTILVWQKPTNTLPLIWEMKRQYGSLDNVIIMYFPFIDLIEQFGATIDHSEELVLDYQFFNSVCAHLQISDSQKLIFKNLSDFDFENGDNLILNYSRLDFYVDFIRLGIEQGYDLTQVGSVIDPVDLNCLEVNYRYAVGDVHDYTTNVFNKHDRLFRPFAHLTRKQVWDLVEDDDLEYFNLWMSKCPYANPNNCLTHRQWRLCKECEIRKDYVRGENS